MKLRLLTFTILVFILSPLHSIAVNTTEVDHLKNKTHPLTDISVGQFIALDFDKLQESKLIKINWIQKAIFKAAQKKLAKKVANGKMNSAKSFNQEGHTKAENRRGRLSLILGVAGILLFVIGGFNFITLLSLPLGILALFLGISGVKRDKNHTMGILGIVFGGLLILPFLGLLLFFVAHGGQR